MPKGGAAFIRLLEYIVATLLAGMVVVVFGNVVLRYVFNRTWAWSEEIARFMLVYLVFLGAIIAMYRRQHLGIDILYKIVPPKVQKLFRIISGLLVSLALIAMVDGGRTMVELGMTWPAPATRIPYGYINAVIPLSAALMLFIVAGHLIQEFRGRSE